MTSSSQWRTCRWHLYLVISCNHKTSYSSKISMASGVTRGHVTCQKMRIVFERTIKGICLTRSKETTIPVIFQSNSYSCDWSSILSYFHVMRKLYYHRKIDEPLHARIFSSLIYIIFWIKILGKKLKYFVLFFYKEALRALVISSYMLTLYQSWTYCVL